MIANNGKGKFLLSNHMLFLLNSFVLPGMLIGENLRYCIL